MKEIIELTIVYLLFIIYTIFLFNRKLLTKPFVDIYKYINKDKYNRVGFYISLLSFIFIFIGYILEKNGMSITLLGYSGTIFGGAMTLLGVFLTINHENDLRLSEQRNYDKQRKVDLAIQYKPIMEVCQFEGKKKTTEVEEGKLRVRLPIKNIGRGEAYNVYCQLSCVNKPIKEIDFDILPLNFKKYLLVDIPPDLIDDNLSIKMKMRIEYTDLYSVYSYITETSITYYFEIINNETIKYNYKIVNKFSELLNENKEIV